MMFCDARGEMPVFLLRGRFADVRYGSEADITPFNSDVCSSPEHGH
jgi:hypothetical protein